MTAPIPDQNQVQKSTSSPTMDFVAADAKQMALRYATSYAIYSAPGAISWAGRTVTSAAYSAAFSAYSAASFIGNTVLGTSPNATALNITLNTTALNATVAPIMCPAQVDVFGQVIGYNQTVCYPNEEPSPPPVFKDAHTFGVFSALALPVSQTITYCSRKVLQCQPNTPIRNGVAGFMNFALTPVTTALVANALGYEIEPQAIVAQQINGVIFSLKLGAITMAATLGLKAVQKCHAKFYEKLETIENPSHRNAAAGTASVAVVGGATLTTALALGYTANDMKAAAVSSAAFVIPAVAFGVLASGITELVKTAGDKTAELVRESAAGENEDEDQENEVEPKALS